MRLVLGLDGGGSGCRAAVADEAGHILGRAGGGPANIAADPDGAAASIRAAWQGALDAAGVAGVDAAVLALAGANAAGTVERLRPALPVPEARIVGDAHAATLGALRGRDGIVAALGTGSVFARLRGGVYRQIGGRGLVLGDEGSGAWIGRAALAAALRAEDGHAPVTPFLAALIGDHGGGEAVVAFAQTARSADFAALAPRVLAAADAGDAAAAAVAAAAEGEIAAAIAILQDGGSLPVVFTGGLGPAFLARLGGRWPGAEVRRETALDGALMLARAALG